MPDAAITGGFTGASIKYPFGFIEHHLQIVLNKFCISSPAGKQVIKENVYIPAVPSQYRGPVS
jgi:hypothetical protein